MKKEVKSTKKGRLDTRSEVARILKEAVVPFDFSELDQKRRKSYSDMARTTVDSDVFQNEKAALVGMWVHHIATKCENFDQVRDYQMCIYALEVFADRLKAVGALSREPEPAEDPHAAV